LPEPQSEDEVVELIAVESEMLVSQAAVEDEAQPPRSSVRGWVSIARSVDG
jgi:hypothetical protein